MEIVRLLAYAIAFGSVALFGWWAIGAMFAVGIGFQIAYRLKHGKAPPLD